MLERGHSLLLDPVYSRVVVDFVLFVSVNMSTTNIQNTVAHLVFTLYDLSCVHTLLRLNNLIYCVIQIKGLIFGRPSAVNEV